MSEVSTDHPRSALRRWLRRIARTFGALILLYLLIVLFGLIPVNNGFEPPEDGIEIFVRSTAVHADLVFPISSETIDWRGQFSEDCFRGKTDFATHISIGWGDKGFFLETETWADFRLSTAAKALFWPSNCCLHVEMTRSPEHDKDARSVRISAHQYVQLVNYVLSSFETDAQGNFMQIPGEAYRRNDAFFDAKGTYHCLNTCNSWAGAGMRKVGIRTPWLSPLPKTMFLYLPAPMSDAN